MKYKAWLTLMTGAALLLSGPLAGLAQDGKMAFIDLQRVFTDFNKTQDSDLQLKDQADEFNAERKRMLEEYKALEEGFAALRDEAQNTALSEAVRGTRRDEAEEKLVEMREFKSRIRRFDETRRKQLEDQSRRMRQRIVEEITETVEQYARDQGLLSVVDSSGQSLNGVPVVLFTDAKLDITDEILDLLNKEAE